MTAITARDIPLRHFETNVPNACTHDRRNKTSVEETTHAAVYTEDYSRVRSSQHSPPLDASARVTVTKRRTVSALRSSASLPPLPARVPSLSSSIAFPSPSASGAPAAALRSCTTIPVSHWCRTMEVEDGSSRACRVGLPSVVWRGMR